VIYIYVLLIFVIWGYFGGCKGDAYTAEGCLGREQSCGLPYEKLFKEGGIFGIDYNEQYRAHKPK
jgi:hypothetical protein